MADRDNSDATLPSLDAGQVELVPRPELMLTVVFHPDMGRIGEFATLPQGEGVWSLGRNTLEFGRPGGARLPLADRHISRRALAIERRGGSVLLRRGEDSCRCQVAGSELQCERELDTAALVAGVPVMLAHCAVLLLHLSPARSSGELPTFGLVGSSVAMSELRRDIRDAAKADLDVLLRGETGTGKEVLARAIHRESARSGQPMVSVNVAAIPGSLAPAALFGAARGAFTGADRARQGYFQQASGGTLFLDEVGDAPVEVQPQLLRALQQREIQPVGGSIQRVDVRVISATDAALEGEVAGFKSALRHRLGALEIHLPPLRQHREDIGELLRHFLCMALEKQGLGGLVPGEGASPREIAGWALLFEQAVNFDWPGNVRQLVNVCNQVAVASGECLRIPGSVAALFAPAEVAPASATQDSHQLDYRSMRDVSDEEFDRAMHDSYHEVAGVAQRLGVSRQSVYRRMASSGLYRKASELPEPELRDAVRECGGDTLAASRLLRVSASGLRSRLRSDASGLTAGA